MTRNLKIAAAGVLLASAELGGRIWIGHDDEILSAVVTLLRQRRAP